MPYYGGIIVRITDRCILSQCMTSTPSLADTTTSNNSSTSTAPPTVTSPSYPIEISMNVWAEVIAKCSTSNYRSSFAVPGDAPGSRFGVHVCTDDTLGYGLVSDADTSRRLGQLTVDEVTKLFKKMFPESVARLTPKQCDAFRKPFAQLLVRYSDEKNLDDKVTKVRSAVEEVREIALDNVEKVLQRGSQIDDIVAQTEELQSQSQGFHTSARNLKNQMWWNSMKTKLALGGLVAAFLLIVFFVFCGGGCGKSST